MLVNAPPMREAGHVSGPPVVDYTLHGLLTIRLTNAPSTYVQEMRHLLGPSSGPHADQPDILITFVDDLGSRGSLRYIDLNQAAYDADRFYLLDQRGRRILFDFEQLGDQCEFICERGASLLRYLLPIISLRLLRKGYLMLHSSSFVFDGKGILVTGWQKGGKTETLLAFMSAGAEYLSDEWTILAPGEGIMWGIPGMLQIWDWHLRQMPQYWRRVSPSERRRLVLLRQYQRAYPLLPAWLKRRGLIGQWLHQLSLDGGISLIGQSRTAPEQLFGDRFRRTPARTDVVFLAGVADQIAVRPIEPSEVARRMVASLAYERRTLLACYQQFRYAFPERANSLLQTAGEMEFRLLEQALRDKPAHEVLHPYPVSLEGLYEACVPVVGNQSNVTAA